MNLPKLPTVLLIGVLTSTTTGAAFINMRIT